jgi:hypothetical protein
MDEDYRRYGVGTREESKAIFFKNIEVNYHHPLHVFSALFFYF